MLLLYVYFAVIFLPVLIVILLPKNKILDLCVINQSLTFGSSMLEDDLHIWATFSFIQSGV